MRRHIAYLIVMAAYLIALWLWFPIHTTDPPAPNTPSAKLATTGDK